MRFTAITIMTVIRAWEWGWPRIFRSIGITNRISIRQAEEPFYVPLEDDS